MNKEIEHIFGSLPSEKHYVPNTISDVDSRRTDLLVTAGQNANWTYANFFILDTDSPITQFSINEGQYVVANYDGEWGIWDYKNNQVARGLAEIEAFVKKVSEAESMRLSYLNRETKESTFATNSQVVTTISKPPVGVDLIYLRAMRTKPFLLLAGISGTGKSRIVKQMAFDSCPTTAQTEEWNLPSLRNDNTIPGNYCLVEVKPNWHDSSELMGYESQINGAHYVLTTFVRFLVKAMVYEKKEVPFFVCLDEMNLAPVEQYFAEFLSVLESRKVVEGWITSEALIKSDVFANKDYELKLKDSLFGLEIEEEITDNGKQRIISGKLPDYAEKIYELLKKDGLRIPSNLIVIGTVNMDETTHQFSRKVIDRAMTIEMNLPEGDPFTDFFNNARDLEYTNNPTLHKLYLPTLVKAADVVARLADDNAEETELLKKEVAKILTALNDALNDTPFKIAYRVQNELMLYFYELWQEDKSRDWNEILRDSVDQILMMKVLPRIEGDEDLLGNVLDKNNGSLNKFVEPYTNARKKVAEMTERLSKQHFTSYWP